MNQSGYFLFLCIRLYEKDNRFTSLLSLSIVVIIVLFWSGHRICVGYETNDEEEGKIIQIYTCQRAHIKY